MNASPVAASLLSVDSAAALLQQLTAACDAYDATGAKEAEAFLVAFRALPQPFPYTRHALHHASSARVLHLSLSTHTAALMRCWPVLAASERQREAEALLWFVSERAAGQQHFVSSQAAHAAALLFARYWLEGGRSAEWANERLQLLLDRLSAARAVAALSSVRLCVDIVQSLVGEMSLSCHTYLSLGVSAVSVVVRHESFERIALLPLLTRITQLMRSLSPSLQSSPDTADVLLRCARAVECCLAWHFQVERDTALRYLSSVQSETDIVALPTRLQPPGQWRAVLLESDVLDVLVQCDRQLLLSHCCSLDVLACLLPLSSLGGAVFLHSSEQRVFLDSLVRHTCVLLDLHHKARQQQQQQQQQAQPVDGKLLTIVHSILSGAMFTLTPPCLFTLSSFPLWLSCLSYMTQCVLQESAFTHSSFTSGTDTTLAEALHAMLATWAELAMASHEERVRGREAGDSDTEQSSNHDTGTTSGNNVAVLDLIEQHGTQLFFLYVTQRLRRQVQQTGEHGDAEEEDGEEEEQFAGADNEQEHLVSLGFLARLQAVSSLTHYQPLLNQFIHSYSTLLSSAASFGSTTSSIELLLCSERLLLLVDLLSCILTDSTEGEASAIPSMLLIRLRDSSALDSVVQSVVSLLSVMLDAVRAGHSSRLSPLLAVSVLSLLYRVNVVYVDVDVAQSLYPDPSSVRSLLLSSVCLSRLVPAQLDAVSSFVSLWHGESEVHNAALRCLSPLIAHNRSRPVATSTAGYRELCQLLQSAASPPSSSSSATVPLSLVDRLSSSTQSLLVCVLSQSCDDERNLNALWSPIQSRLSYVTHRVEHGASRWLSDPCAVVYCSSSVSLLCGVSESTSATSFDASFALLSARWADLTQLLRVAVTVPSSAPVVSAILSLLVSSAEHQLSYMDASQSSRFMVLCADAVGEFLQAMQQRVAAVHRQAVRAEAELLADSYEEDVTLLLRLLSELIRDDTWAAGLDSVERAGELCVVAATTLVSDGLFMQLLAASASSSSSSSPTTVVSLFFSLLHDAFTTHTDRIAALPPAARSRLLSVLLRAPSQVARQCLQCVAALASHLAKQRAASLHQSAVEEDVARMLHWLLTSLISQPLPSALLEPISDALLACCVAIPQRIGELAAAAINDWQQQRQQRRQQQGSDQLAAELSAVHCGLVDLVSSNGVRADVSMDNKRKMRANVRHFVNVVNKGIV